MKIHTHVTSAFPTLRWTCKSYHAVHMGCECLMLLIACHPKCWKCKFSMKTWFQKLVSRENWALFECIRIKQNLFCYILLLQENIDKQYKAGWCPSKKKDNVTAKKSSNTFVSDYFTLKNIFWKFFESFLEKTMNKTYIEIWMYFVYLD